MLRSTWLVHDFTEKLNKLYHEYTFNSHPNTNMNKQQIYGIASSFPLVKLVTSWYRLTVEQEPRATDTFLPENIKFENCHHTVR